MSMFSNSVDKILKGAHFIIADLDQHAKNMLRDVAVHSETIAQATEKKMRASAEHQRAVLLAERFKSLITIANVPQAGQLASQAKNVGVSNQQQVGIAQGVKPAVAVNPVPKKPM